MADNSRQLCQWRMSSHADYKVSFGCSQPIGLGHSPRERGHGLRRCSQPATCSTSVRIKFGVDGR